MAGVFSGPMLAQRLYQYPTRGERRPKLHVHVGPCAVAQLATKLRSAGIEVTCEGTETIHCLATPDEVASALGHRPSFMQANSRQGFVRVY